MVVNQPHFLLFTDAHLSKSQACPVNDQGFGRWHFVLERLDGPERLEAADSESDVHRDRLALLAVVRGLEALEQPSQVTLVTTSRYVSRGLRYGLNEWREAEYTWEHFGMQKPIRNADLWQRIDCAMHFHQVTCRLLQSPLAQAIVESAAELDELGMITHPLDAAFAAPGQVVADAPASVASQRPAPLGLIRRVDSAHQAEAGLPQQSLAETIGERPNSSGLSFAPTLVRRSPSALLQAATHVVQKHAQALHNATEEPDLRPNFSPQTQELERSADVLRRRPRISITLPAAFLQRATWASETLFAFTALLRSWWVKLGLQVIARRVLHPLRGPLAATT